MVGATASFTGMLALVKALRPHGYGSLELMGWRALTAIPVLLLFRRAWRVRQWKRLALRCGFGAAAMFCYYAATQGLGVGEVSLLAKLQPVLVALVAPLWLGEAERPGARTWQAVLLGLTGTAAIALPSLGSEPIRLLSVGAGLASAVFSTMAHTLLRSLKDEDPDALVFWFQVSVAGAVVVGLALGAPRTTPEVVHLPMLLAIGLCALAGQVLMTRAYSADRAARIATAGYVGPLFGFLLDVLVFGVPLRPESIVGAVCIGLAGWRLLR